MPAPLESTPFNRSNMFSKHYTLLPALLLAASTGTWAADAPPAAAAASAPADANALALKTLKEKYSYATGVMTTRNLVKNEVQFDIDLLIRGLRDGMSNAPIQMSEKELKVVLQSMQAEMQRHMTAERTLKATTNRDRGTKFQEEYRKDPKTVQLPGGLMYRLLKAGKGDRPTDTSTVVMRYRGTLVDGTEFEAVPEGKTVTMKVLDMIIGWREVLKQMNAGSEVEVVIPPSMAYGNRGAGNIGPNETLVFKIELVALVQPTN